jgi:hypothetical protein
VTIGGHILTIFLIDKITKKNIGNIDFIPHKEDRILLNNDDVQKECVVCAVMYMPDEHTILVFVDVPTGLYYSAMVDDIQW